MDWLEAVNLRHFFLFTLVLTRLGGLTVLAPIYGSAEVPLQVRALLAVALSLLVTPIQSHVVFDAPGNLVDYLLLVAGELVVGLSLGLGVVVLFAGIQVAGQVASQVSGMALANVFNPSLGTNAAMFAQLFYMVSLAVFVLVGGHRMVMAGLLHTYELVPPGAILTPPSSGEIVAELLTAAFQLAVRAAAPTMTAVLLSTFVMGLISRTLPQLNIMAVGFGINSMVAFGTLSLTLGAVVWALADQVEPVLEMVIEAVHEAAPAAPP